MDKDNDGFVSYDEFIGATKDPEYEKPPEENWQPIDDDKEYTDEEFEEYEKQYGDYDEEVSFSFITTTIRGERLASAAVTISISIAQIYMWIHDGYNLGPP